MILVILFPTLILKSISLNRFLWLDKAITALVAKMPVADIFDEFMSGDFHSPFYDEGLGFTF